MALLPGVENVQQRSYGVAEVAACLLQSAFTGLGDHDFVGAAVVWQAAAGHQLPVLQVVDDADQGGLVDPQGSAQFALGADLSVGDGGQYPGMLQLDARGAGGTVGRRACELMGSIQQCAKGIRVDRLLFHSVMLPH